MKHPELIVRPDLYAVELPKNCQETNHAIRDTRGFSSIGTHYIQFQVQRGSFHSMIGLADPVTSTFPRSRYNVWVPIERGFACCMASDGLV